MDREVDSTHRVCTGRCTVLFLDVLPPSSSSSACLLERRTDGRTAGATGATGGGGRADDVSSGELPAVVVAVRGRCSVARYTRWSGFVATARSTMSDNSSPAVLASDRVAVEVGKTMPALLASPTSSSGIPETADDASLLPDTPKSKQTRSSQSSSDMLLKLDPGPTEFELMSPVAKQKKIYPSGIKFIAQCLYCNKKWRVEMGADNLVCSCGNQLYVMEELSRVAYDHLKEKLVKQLMSHYKKFKSKQDLSTSEASGAATATESETADTPSATSTELEVPATSPMEMSVTNDADSVASTNETVAGTAVDTTMKKEPTDRDDAETPSTEDAEGKSVLAKEHPGSVQSTAVLVGKQGDAADASEGAARTSVLGKRSLGESGTVGPATVKLSTTAMGNLKVGSTGPNGSPRAGQTSGAKRPTLIVQCPKCHRNVIVPGVIVFQCPCGQYMTIQKPDSPKVVNATVAAKEKKKTKLGAETGVDVAASPLASKEE